MFPSSQRWDAGRFGADFSGPDDFDIDFEMVMWNDEEVVPRFSNFDFSTEVFPVRRWKWGYVWTTKKNTQVPVRYMEDSHLLNSHRFVRRKLPVATRSLEIASEKKNSDVIDDFGSTKKEVTGYFRRAIKNINEWVRIFDEEISRRKLTPLSV